MLKSCVDRSFIKYKSRRIDNVIKYSHESNTEKLTVTIGREVILLDPTNLSSKEIVDYFNSQFEKIGANVKMEL